MIACDNMMATADKIKALRGARALTQDDLAAMSGLGIATIQRAERGARIAPNSLASIAAAFGIPASELGADEADTFEPYLALEPITSGRQLVALLRAGRHLDFGFGELDDLEDARTIEAFQQFCVAMAGYEGELLPTAQVERELEAKEHLAELGRRGFRVGGAGFDITAYDVDDDGGMGMGIICAQWDETRTALRVGASAEDVARAHVLEGLDKYEVVQAGQLVHPAAPPQDEGWDDFIGAPSGRRED